MARVLLAEALLLDFQLAEARALAGRAASATELPAWVRARAELALARSLELQGDGAAAAAHYRAAASAGDPAAARLALQALRAPAPAAAIEAARLLGSSRRLAERGDEREAERLCGEAFRVFPKSDEGRLCAARTSLRERNPALARALAQPLLAAGRPWLRPQARLVLAAALESERDRTVPLRVGGALRSRGAARAGGCRAAPATAGGGAARSAASRAVVFKILYKKRPPRSVSHIFVVRARTRAKPVGSGWYFAEISSESQFQRFPHRRAQPNVLQPNGMAAS
jgi:hypothetical protein